MSETIKQAVARCRGDVFLLLHPNYTDEIETKLKVSKPEARRVIDRAPKDQQPQALWVGYDLILMPNCSDEGDMS